MAAKNIVSALISSSNQRGARETAALAAAVSPKPSGGLEVVAALIRRSRS